MFRIDVLAGAAQSRIFTTNLVHCHPENDAPSERQWINKCEGYLHEELAIIKPLLIIGLGDDAGDELRKHFCRSTELAWPFTDPPKIRQNAEAPLLLFPEHPGSLRFKRHLIGPTGLPAWRPRSDGLSIRSTDKGSAQTRFRRPVDVAPRLTASTSGLRYPGQHRWTRRPTPADHRRCDRADGRHSALLWS